MLWVICKPPKNARKTKFFSIFSFNLKRLKKIDLYNFIINNNILVGIYKELFNDFKKLIKKFTNL